MEIKDELISGSADYITVGGKELEVWPLSDKDLGTLTNWIRFQIKQKANEESEFVDSMRDKRRIKDDAARFSLTVQWFTAEGISLALNEAEGLIFVIMLMTKNKWKKDFFLDKFGSISEITEVQLENRSQVQEKFLEMNTLGGGAEEEEGEDNGEKKESEDSEKN